MSNHAEDVAIIESFMDAVYGGNGALALTSFNEMQALKDATEKIVSLTAENERLREALESILCDVTGYIDETTDYPSMLALIDRKATTALAGDVHKEGADGVF